MDTPEEAASGVFEGVIIEDVVGVGVDGWGVTSLELVDLRITGVLAGADGQGVGIRVGPTPVGDTSQFSGVDRISTGTRTRLDLQRSRITRSVGAGVVVRGAQANISGLAVRDVRPDLEGVATGIPIEPLGQGSVAPEAIIRESVVAHVAGTGIRLDSATTAVVEDVTIRDVGHDMPQEDAEAGCAA